MVLCKYLQHKLFLYNSQSQNCYFLWLTKCYLFLNLLCTSYVPTYLCCRCRYTLYWYCLSLSISNVIYGLSPTNINMSNIQEFMIGWQPYQWSEMKLLRQAHLRQLLKEGVDEMKAIWSHEAYINKALFSFYRHIMTRNVMSTGVF